MSEEKNLKPDESAENEKSQERREFLGSMGKWSSAATIAAVGGAAWISTPGTAQAGRWVNRNIGGGGWVNRSGGGGWVNRRGGGGWINGR